MGREASCRKKHRLSVGSIIKKKRCRNAAITAVILIRLQTRLSSAEQMCKDVGRLSEDQWEAVNAADRDAENGVQPTRELEALRSTCRVAILYALGYLYEHRDEADHKQLMLTLRSILFAVREGVF